MNKSPSDSRGCDPPTPPAPNESLLLRKPTRASTYRWIFTLRPFDFVTLKLDSLWKRSKTCNYPFSIPAARWTRGRRGVVVVVVVANNPRKSEVPISAHAQVLWTVGGKPSAWTESIQEELRKGRRLNKC